MPWLIEACSAASILCATMQTNLRESSARPVAFIIQFLLHYSDLSAFLKSPRYFRRKIGNNTTASAPQGTATLARVSAR
jgi:hypothetical protein